MEDEQINPECFVAEKDTPYPLCIGDKEECKHCCLSINYMDAGWKEE